MIRHIALFRFNDDATAEQRQTVVDALRTLSGVVPSIRGYEVSTTLGLVPEGAQLCVVALFDDEQGWRDYIDHPEHRRVADTLLAPIRSERVTMQHAYPVE